MKKRTEGRTGKSPGTSDREGALRRMLGNDLVSEEAKPHRMENARKKAGHGHRLKLRIRSGETAKTEDCRDADLIRIGRDPSNNVVIPSRFCSRRQLEIFTRRDGYYIRNLSRTNPTVILRGNRRVAARDGVCRILDGDRIKIGDVRIETDILWDDKAENHLWE